MDFSADLSLHMWRRLVKVGSELECIKIQRKRVCSETASVAVITRIIKQIVGLISKWEWD